METLTELLERPCWEIEAHWTDPEMRRTTSSKRLASAPVPLWIHLGTGCATAARAPEQLLDR
jgi:hypothetical protein